MKSFTSKFFAYIILMSICSCGVKKTITNDNHEQIDINALINQINTPKTVSDWLFVKGKIKFKSNNDKIGLGFSMKIRPDSLIWVSINAPILGEVNRLMLTKDSVYSINRTNNSYLIRSLDQLENDLGVNLSFNKIENLLLSNIKIPQNNYSLLREGDNIKINHIPDSTSYVIDSKKKTLEQYSLIYSKDKDLLINYSNHSVDGPQAIEVLISEPILHVELTYNKIEERKKEKASFVIPSNYENLN